VISTTATMIRKMTKAIFQFLTVLSSSIPLAIETSNALWHFIVMP
jgi:hypothetical protein